MTIDADVVDNGNYQSVTFSTGETPAVAPQGSLPVDTKQEGTRPEGLPEGFNSWEELVTAYNAVKGGEAPTPTPEGEAPAQEQPAAYAVPEEVPETLDDLAARETEAIVNLTNAGVDYEAITKQYLSTGEISEDNYASLEAAGYPRALVDAFVEVKQGQAEATKTALLQEVGGEAKFQQLAQFARTNYTPAQLEAYNTAVSSGDYETVSQAVRALKAAYEGKRGVQPQYIQGTTAPSTGAGDVFRDMSEFLDAIGDEKYTKSDAYRKAVADKLARSHI